MHSPHPWQERSALSLAQQVQHYRELGALAYDQLWWVSLPWWRRGLLWLQGYRAPIHHHAFYLHDQYDTDWEARIRRRLRRRGR